MMLGQERPFTARQNIGIVLARVQLTGIRCDGDTVNWRAEIVKCSCWYSPRCHDLWAGIAAKHRYCNFQGADALTKLHKCESAIKKRHLHFLKLLFRQAAQRVGRTFKKKKKKRKNLDFFFFSFPRSLCRTYCSEAINLIVYFPLLALSLLLFPMPAWILLFSEWNMFLGCICLCTGAGGTGNAACTLPAPGLRAAEPPRRPSQQAVPAAQPSHLM